MDASLIYAIIVASLTILPVILTLLPVLWRTMSRPLAFFILEHLVYPLAVRRWREWTTNTRLGLLMQLGYMALNTGFNLIGVQDLTAAQRRSAVLAMINWIPLTFTGQPSLAASMTGLSLQAIVRAHGTVGLVLLVQGIIHVILVLKKESLAFSDPVQLWGFVASLCIGYIFCMLILRRRLYEVTMKLHYILSVVALGALWAHTPERSSLVYLLVATAILSSATLMRFFHTLIRNLCRGQPYSRAIIEYRDRAIKATVTVPRPFRVRAGQHVHLWIPGIDFWSFFQAHPYTITWWNNDADGNAATVQFLAWLDGPYGVHHDLGDYGLVLLYATGVGIVAQMPYLKELIRGYREHAVRTKRLVLNWEVDDETNQDWVCKWMDELLVEDSDHIMRLHLYQDQGGMSSETAEVFGNHDRVHKFPFKMDVDEIFDQELQKKRGSMAVSVSATPAVRDQVRELVRRNVACSVTLFEPDFQPNEIPAWFSRPRACDEANGI